MGILQIHYVSSTRLNDEYDCNGFGVHHAALLLHCQNRNWSNRFLLLYYYSRRNYFFMLPKSSEIMLRK
jgi:hypothetical protein